MLEALGSVDGNGLFLNSRSSMPFLLIRPIMPVVTFVLLRGYSQNVLKKLLSAPLRAAPQSFAEVSQSR